MDPDLQDESERPQKRTFLREQIINKGYSPEEFTDYCDILRGADIDLWTLAELKECVRNFQAMQAKKVDEEKNNNEEPENWPSKKSVSSDSRNQSAEEVKISPPQESSKNENIPAVITLENVEETKEVVEETKQEQSETIEAKNDQHLEVKQEPQRTLSSFEDTKTYFLNALKASDNQLSKEISTDVNVGCPEYSTGGMFSTTKINFPITTKPFNWKVKRQEDDFVWLKGILNTCFPTSYLPPNPPKRVIGAHGEENQEKQQAYLQHFLSTIVRNPLFKRSPFLLGFLKEDDPKEFAKLKKQAGKVKKPQNYSEFLTLDGYLACDPRHDEKENANIEDYLKNTEILKKKLKRQTDSLCEAVHNVAAMILDIARSFEALENLQDKFPGIPGVKPLYNSLKTSFAIWSDRENESAEIVKNYCNFFFKYEYNEVIPLIELAKEKEIKSTAYQKALQKLKGKKEKLWQAKDISKWGLSAEALNNTQTLLEDKEAAFAKMMAKETKELEKLRDDFAFYNYQVKSETSRVFIDNQAKENAHFTEFGRVFSDYTTKLHELWADLVATLTQVRHECIQAFHNVS